MVFPLIKMIVLPSGNHCRSLFVAPSFVNCSRPVPSIFIVQISLLATKAILSAPPNVALANTVAVSVGVGGASVSVASTMTTGTTVTSFTGAEVSVAGGGSVKVLTGASVSTGVLVPLYKKTPPARAATTTTGMTTNNALNPFFWAVTGCLLIAVPFTVGAAFICNFVGSPRRTACKAFIMSTAVAKRSFLSFAMAFWMIASIPAGSFGLVSRICGTGSVMCLMATPMGVCAS